MAGNIKVNKDQLSKDLSVAFQIAAFHEGAKAPGFGGELEVMLLKREGDGFQPIPYQSAEGIGTKDVFQTFQNDYGYTTKKSIDGEAAVLSGKDRSILCMEKYASVIERTDTSFPATEEGMQALLDSVDSFATRIDNIANDFDLLVSPYDYDPYCHRDIFDESMEAPSERFGDDGYLGKHDMSHPKVDMIDRRTTSCHFSVGYRDHDHLKKMMKLLTVLTPSIYAAYSTVKPTYVANIDGQTKLLNEEDALSFNGVKTAVPVPRALAWALAVPERSGLPAEIIEAVMNEDSLVEDVIKVYCDYSEIINTPPDNPESFMALAEQGGMDMGKYAKHIGTLWLDWRVDPVRLEARMAGTGPWKLNSMACLMLGAFMNEDGLNKALALIDETNISVQDIIDARQNVAFKGTQTPIGDNHTCLSLLKDIAAIAKENIPSKFHAHLKPLEQVLEFGMSDSEILLQEDYDGIDLATIPLAERKPLAAYAKVSKDIKPTFEPE